MKDKELYAQILGIKEPWRVIEIDLNLSAGEVKVHVEYAAGVELSCPECGTECSGYDKRQRTWRHLDTCQFKTLLIADVPRVTCKTHGVKTVKVPWAEPYSGFTALFEALVIDWLREATLSAVSRRLGLSWNAIDGIMRRAVQRGLSRRALQPIKHLSVDETSFKKRHDYVTVVSDQEKGRVVYVADDRTKDSLKGYYDTLDDQQKATIGSISMDMWPAYINATLEALPEANRKIGFDKFHVAKYLGDAVDSVRKQEHRTLQKEDNQRLKGSKYLWLTNPDNMSRQRWKAFKSLRESALKTARAWGIKEMAMSLWCYVSRTWAEKGWKKWLSWAMRSRLAPIKVVAKIIKQHLWGILNAITLNVHNGHAESINSKIKMIKVRSRGFRNKDRYKNAIYFYLGGLDLYPNGINTTSSPT